MDDDRIADGHAIHAVAQRRDGGGELVTHDRLEDTRRTHRRHM